MQYKKTHTILDKICENKILEISERMKKISLDGLQKKIKADKEGNNYEKRDFAGALKKEGLSLIAEIKNFSPSAGQKAFREGFNPLEIAHIFEDHGASSISVITEEKFFNGSLDFLPLVKGAAGLPVLRKDFIFDPYQLYESKAFGADAVLLIAAILEEERLKELYSLAGRLDLDVLVEAHDENECRIITRLMSGIKKPGSSIIGINNRDLKSMKIDINNFPRLSSLIPDDIIKVAESGINCRLDAVKMKAAGADAILVGTSLMKAGNIGEAIDELMAFDDSAAENT